MSIEEKRSTVLLALDGSPAATTAGLSIQVYLVAGHIADEIAQFAAEHHSDAIVLVRRSHLEDACVC